MPYTKSQDLRDRAIALCDDDMPTSQVARLLGVCPAWVRRVMQVRRETGRTTPLPRGGKRYQKIDPDRLRALATAHPDATEVELHEKLGIDCSVSAVGEALRRMGLTFKKRQSMRPNNTGPTSPKNDNAGVMNNPTTMHRARSSSTRPGRKPT